MKSANANAFPSRKKIMGHRVFNVVDSKVVVDKVDFKADRVGVVLPFSQERQVVEVRLAREVAAGLLLSVAVPKEVVVVLVHREVVTDLLHERISRLTRKKFNAEYRKPRPNFQEAQAKARV